MNIEKLKSQLKDKTIIVFSCGPSLKDWEEVIKDYPDAIRICIKDSIDLVNTKCDVHILNYVNLKRYKYKQKRPYIIYGKSDHYCVNIDKSDFTYKVISDSNLLNTIAACADINDFDKMMSFSNIRPWGPGIMYEIVFPLLVHCSVKKIVTIGWDIADGFGNNKHYNDKNHMNMNKSNTNFFLKSLAKYLIKSFPFIKSFKQIVDYRLSYCKLACGKKINKSGMMEGEAELISSSIDLLKLWLSDKKIELEIRSNSKWQY